ncbi:pentapeptide repeat-containing protein [Fischerella sp. JS2]|uniref:pentapeptide repeat-containing protein n=1 Tax=Fischerella sp. JS2 TaxID=2597771 RepID=UPI0028EBE5ED|nr:pentapeptide repeat-containing protein [Fischerella sp. JS2]
MATPIVRRSNDQSSSSQSSQPGKPKTQPLAARRVAAWATEMTLLVISGLVPFSLGVYLNTRTDLNRVPLNPVLIVTEREIARPLALPVSYGTRNVAWPTNFLWTVAILAPLTLSAWQLLLLAKTGSTLPKRWFGVRVVNSQGKPPGLGAVLLREGIGRWTLSLSVAYMLWRNSPTFPNLGVFTFLSGLIMLLEARGLPLRQRRALHDIIAGTYTIDANQPFTPSQLQDKKQTQWTEAADEDAAIASVVITPSETTQPPAHPWEWLQRNPSITLLAIALLSMAGVLTTLVGTQVYIQTQQNRRVLEQRNSQLFLALVKQLSPNSGVSNEERRRAILAMGTLNDPQATKYLVELLAKETDPSQLETIQQALTNIGLSAIPDLKRMNQSLADDLESTTNPSLERELRQKRLQSNQQAINKIIALSSAKVNDLDLSRTQLFQNGAADRPIFSLALDKVDLSGINFKGANLSFASLRGSSFRGVGEDRRWDTFDDWIADLSGAQFKQADLRDTNLSRVLMVRTDFSRANLKGSNLTNARLVNANLSSAQLMGADVRGAVLENASLTGADLSEAIFNDADLYAARLGRVIAIGTQLPFANLSKTDWQAADLSGANLQRADLSNANLSATSLTNANLRSANLTGVNFRNADLSLADLRGANLTEADFQGAILFPAKQDPADQFVQTPSTGSQSAVVKGVDFSQAKNLDTKQLAYICTQGGIHPRCP